MPPSILFAAQLKLPVGRRCLPDHLGVHELPQALSFLHQLFGWEAGRAKNCMLLTGNSAIEGGKATPDPKEMWCNDQRKADPDGMWDYIHICTVRLDEQGERTFSDGHHFAVPLICEKASSTETKCMFDGTAAAK